MEEKVSLEGEKRKEEQSRTLFFVSFSRMFYWSEWFWFWFVFFSEKETLKPHTHPVELSKLVLLDLIK